MVDERLLDVPEEAALAAVMAGAMNLQTMTGNQRQTTTIALMRALSHLIEPDVIKQHIQDGERQVAFGCFTQRPADYQNESDCWPVRKALLEAVLNLRECERAMREKLGGKPPIPGTEQTT